MSDGAGVDALLHPSMQARVEAEALLTGRAMATGQTILVATDETLQSVLARTTLTTTAPRALYGLCVD